VAFNAFFNTRLSGTDICTDSAKLNAGHLNKCYLYCTPWFATHGKKHFLLCLKHGSFVPKSNHCRLSLCSSR